MKVCKKCQESKPLDQFYGNGYFPYCKECHKRSVRENYRKNPEKRREYERTRRKRPPGYSTEASRKHRRNNPEKYKARTAVNNAIRDGRLKRQPCKCGNPKSQAHHADYSKPLDVTWLCRRCHWREEHGGV